MFAKIPNDSLYNLQDGMWNLLGAPAAWDVATGSNKVIVAVIDTGADIWHKDLKKNIWKNPYEIEDNGIDDDNNGYIDDIHGWNFVEENNDVRTTVFGETDDKEAVRHGTIIAGLLGAEGNNEFGVAGVNWKIKLMPIRAIENTGSGSFVKVANAVDYAVDNGASVINMSFVGDSIDSVLAESLRRAYEKNVVVVSAAGNHKAAESGDLDEKPMFPACLDKNNVSNWLLAV
ncbi:MAG: S8 family serine peptidase [Patescibacteria group bacterium]